MRFTIEMDEKLIIEAVTKEFSVKLNAVTREIASKAMENYRGKVEKAVELYLAKRLTDKEISSLIDKAVAVIIEDKIARGSY